MFTIAIVAQKGGVGKSVLSVGLAVASTLAGMATVVIDLDPQASSAKWKDRRAEENPHVVSSQASRLKQVLEASRKAEIDLAVIDTAGRNDDSALQAARAADLVLVPCPPVLVDLETLPAVQDVLGLARNPPAFVVLNKIHPTATKQPDEARDLISRSFGFRCAPVHLSARAAYGDALTTGQTPQELDPEGKAADELKRLFEFTIEFLKSGRSEHGKGVRNTSAA